MIEVTKGGVRLHLFIQPNSSKDEIVGPYNDELKIKLTAPPVDGKANEALIKFLAGVLKMPKKNFTLIRGDAGRHKVVEISGIDEEELRNRIKI